MNYEHPELRSLLAAEYVLGILTGRARRRFERLLSGSVELRRELVFWESRLSALGLELTPIDPPDRVWERIQQRLGRRAAPPQSAPEKPPLWHSVNLWRGAFAIAATVAIALAAALWLVPTAPPAPPQVVNAERPARVYVSTINNKQNKPAWLVTADPATATMSIRVLPDHVKPPSGKALELWIIPANGHAPVAMAMLPAKGIVTGKMPKKVADALQNAKALAVSLEPPGGSPTGQPTGPVLFTAGVIANI